MTWQHPLFSGLNLYIEGRISSEDASRQTATAGEILRRLAKQPGLVLADEVGMGKTFVALAVAASVALNDAGGRPVVAMVPPSLKEKWPHDFELFRKRCLPQEAQARLRYGKADKATTFLKLLDDPKDRRSSLIFLTHGAMNRALDDGWMKLAFIHRALHGRHQTKQLRRVLGRTAGRLLSLGRADRDPEMWEELLRKPPSDWLTVLHAWDVDPEGDGNPDNDDDPVPAALLAVLEKLRARDTDELYAVLNRDVPQRQTKHYEWHLKQARHAIRDEIRKLWDLAIQRMRFRLPLLILDEAHHLKNPGTRLAGLFQVSEAQDDAAIVERGALHGVFERMLFLTATPFQLGHHELCSVIERFSGTRMADSQSRKTFLEQVSELRRRLDAAQQSSLTLDKVWSRLDESDLKIDGVPHSPEDDWWPAAMNGRDVSPKLQEVLSCFSRVQPSMKRAEEVLAPWVIRHVRPKALPNPFQGVPRRDELPGRRILLVGDGNPGSSEGISIQGQSLLPFLLAARATACTPKSRPVFAEGLASSYEAFLLTRQRVAKDPAGAEADVNSILDGDDDPPVKSAIDKTAMWYLAQLEKFLPRNDPLAMAGHPKIAATVQRAVETWARGEKVVVFCHYVATGRALRERISEAIRRKTAEQAAAKLGCPTTEAEIELERLGDRFFDTDSPVRRACDHEIRAILSEFPPLAGRCDDLVEIVRRNLRTPSFLARFFPLERTRQDEDSVRQALETEDASGLSLRQQLRNFFEFLAHRLGEPELIDRYVEALLSVQTGSHIGERLASYYSDDELQQAGTEALLPNVRLVNGSTRQITRQRLMLTFNTPFYPEILVASSVMAEGVDLHLNCRHVIHHDLCWNPSTLEQRTGRIDRIGAKAEVCGRSIQVFLPYVSQTQDEKMYRVVVDRRRWFSILMGEEYDEYANDVCAAEKLAARVPLPESAAAGLRFQLAVLTKSEPAAGDSPHSMDRRDRQPGC